jgi:hypothetical protein
MLKTYGKLQSQPAIALIYRKIEIVGWRSVGEPIIWGFELF